MMRLKIVRVLSRAERIERQQSSLEKKRWLSTVAVKSLYNFPFGFDRQISILSHVTKVQNALASCPSYICGPPTPTTLLFVRLSLTKVLGFQTLQILWGWVQSTETYCGWCTPERRTEHPVSSQILCSNISSSGSLEQLSCFLSLASTLVLDDQYVCLQDKHQTHENPFQVHFASK